MLWSLPLPQGWGSGAGDSDVWHEVMARHDVSSAGLLIDRYAKVADQPQMLAGALSLLQRRGRQQTGSRPVLRLPVSTLINLDTEELDKSKGVVISLNYYWTLCEDSIITHEEGRTEREMKRIADSHAGAAPPALDCPSCQPLAPACPPP